MPRLRLALSPAVDEVLPVRGRVEHQLSLQTQAGSHGLIPPEISQTFTPLSLPPPPPAPVTMVFPSARIATPATMGSSTSTLASSRPVATSHSRTVPSAAEVAS